MIDQRLEDDGAMCQLHRLTPDVPFPEAEGNPRACMRYGTPWPLSESYYLCVYDADAKNRGVYWIDRYGNRELIYRDPAISVPEPHSAAAPAQAARAAGPDDGCRAKSAGDDRPATVAVMNVYDSDFAWPAGTKIAALRIIQVLPKSTPPPNQPRIGVADQTNARAVLGTVPVEADGSAYFQAPVGKPIYFQALDANGLAVQSMRSATYVHPGEQLTCQGCHEPKRRSSPKATQSPLAIRRPPSQIAPEPDGSNPFNYPRLVQPVLDRHCVACHARRSKALDLSGTVGGPNGWTRSYTSLAGKYGFYFNVSNGSIKQGVHGGSRTAAGAFGARASKLYQLLEKGHYDVDLPAEDLRRITLWLDCNSEFYGRVLQHGCPGARRGGQARPGIEGETTEPVYREPGTRMEGGGGMAHARNQVAGACCSVLVSRSLSRAGIPRIRRDLSAAAHPSGVLRCSRCRAEHRTGCPVPFSGFRRSTSALEPMWLCLSSLATDDWLPITAIATAGRSP